MGDVITRTNNLLQKLALILVGPLHDCELDQVNCDTKNGVKNLIISPIYLVNLKYPHYLVFIYKNSLKFINEKNIKHNTKV